MEANLGKPIFDSLHCSTHADYDMKTSYDEYFGSSNLLFLAPGALEADVRPRLHTYPEHLACPGVRQHIET